MVIIIYALYIRYDFILIKFIKNILDNKEKEENDLLKLKLSQERKQYIINKNFTNDIKRIDRDNIDENDISLNNISYYDKYYHIYNLKDNNLDDEKLYNYTDDKIKYNPNIFYKDRYIRNSHLLKDTDITLSRKYNNNEPCPINETKESWKKKMGLECYEICPPGKINVEGECI